MKAASHIPKYDKDFVIILGSKINNDGTLPPLLKGRVDKAIDFGNKQYESTKKKIIYVPSGATGYNTGNWNALLLNKGWTLATIS